MTERSDSRPGRARLTLVSLAAFAAATLALAAAPVRAQGDDNATAEAGETATVARQEQDEDKHEQREKQEESDKRDTAGRRHPRAAIAVADGDGIVLTNPQLAEALHRPIDIELRDATVRQMAETMAKSTGLNISVDRAVPDATRVSLEAHHVPVVTVLDAVGRQANLLIAPVREGDAREIVGIQLTRPAMLRVNGQEQSVASTPTFPWASEWGIPPTADTLSGEYALARGQYLLSQYQSGLTARAVPVEAGVADVATTFSGPSGPSGPLTMTAVGSDLVVVAEPGAGERGEPGAWLTLYRLQKDGKGMTRLGSTFHAYHTRPTPPAPAPFGGVVAPPGVAPAAIAAPVLSQPIEAPPAPAAAPKP
jgi:hypothetical protein